MHCLTSYFLNPIRFANGYSWGKSEPVSTSAARCECIGCHGLVNATPCTHSTKYLIAQFHRYNVLASLVGLKCVSLPLFCRNSYNTDLVHWQWFPIYTVSYPTKLHARLSSSSESLPALTLVVTIILYLHILFPGCLTWTQSDNTGVFGGTPQPGVANIAACQAACISNRTCVAIDFDASGCYFVLSAAINNKVPRAGVTHFDLVTGSGCK
jgi:hypothetical protein